jgi:hypothetical protein
VDEGVGDGAHLLQGQEEDLRNRFGHLVDEEKHDGEKLNIDGGRPMMLIPWAKQSHG